MMIKSLISSLSKTLSIALDQNEGGSSTPVTSTVAVTKNTVVQWGAVDAIVGEDYDTHIRELGPTTNYSGNSQFDVTKWAAGDAVNMIYGVSLTEIPAGASIDSAILRLKTYKSGNPNGTEAFTIGAYRISTNPANIDFSTMTWNQSSTGNNWTVPGAWGDLSPTTSLDSVGVGPVKSTWFEWDITAGLSAAHSENPTSTTLNILLERNDIFEHQTADSYIGQARRFHGDTSTDGSRPEIIITFTV